MRTAAAVAILVVLAAPAAADDAVLVGPTPSQGWEQWRVGDGAGAITVYVQHDDQPRPLVVFAAGSHCLPVFFTTDGRERGTLPFDIAAARALEPFQFAIVERTGLTSFTAIAEADVAAYDRCTEAHGGVRKDERARRLAAAASALRRQPWVSSVLVAGHSEGADVASGALRYLAPDEVAAVGFFASGGISQFFELVLRGRRDTDPAAAQQAFTDLLAMTGTSPPAELEGFPRARFVTYAIDSTPLDDLAGRTVPVFIAHGSVDHNSPVENADALAVELLRRDRTRAVHYQLLDGVDHGFRDGAGASHGEALLAQFVRWAAHPTRGVATAAFAPASAAGPAARAPIRVLGLPLGVVAGVLVALGIAALLWRARGRHPLVASIVAIAALIAAGLLVGGWLGSLAGARNRLVHAIAGALGGTLIATNAVALARRHATRIQSSR